jgi:DNA-binding HxlR family transcriptional regulator
MRTYRDLCGIARALDVIGERWALLVVRELMFGPKRFADLHRGLPGMSQNVLTQRLRDLEESGVLIRRRTLPPASGLVYELTDHGRDLEPVLLALGRWGSPLQPGPESASELSPDGLVLALRTTFDPHAAAELAGVVQLELPTDAFWVTVHDGQLDVARGQVAADAILTCSVRTVQDLVFDARPLEDALHTGDATAQGDAAFLKRLLGTFNDHRTQESAEPYGSGHGQDRNEATR